MKKFALFAAGSGLVAVSLGAFGAHGLRDVVSPTQLQVWQTAVHYQMFHTLAILLIVSIGLKSPVSRCFSASVWCFLTGILVFSGSLYLLVLSGESWLGAITPLGGVLFLTGWVLLAIGFVRWK